MTDAPHPYAAPAAVAQPAVDEPIEVVTGEVVDADGAAPRGAFDSVREGSAWSDGAADDSSSDLIDLDDDAVLAEVDEPDESDDTTEADRSEAADVLVLDTWQIAIPATGDAKVDAALARLVDVEGLPPTEHADVYEVVHAGLNDALADLDRS